MCLLREENRSFNKLALFDGGLSQAQMLLCVIRCCVLSSPRINNQMDHKLLFVRCITSMSNIKNFMLFGDLRKGAWSCSAEHVEGGLQTSSDLACF